LPERVVWLEKQFDKLFDEVGHEAGRLDQVIKKNEKQSEALMFERAEREKADEKHEEQLREAEVGNLHLEWAGVGFIVLGTILGTASSEIAWWFWRCSTAA
jgi:hypothetical protein